jgi:hypothetical protein
VLLLDVTVNVALPGAATVSGAKVALLPDGSPVAESATLPLNPLDTETEIE